MRLTALLFLFVAPVFAGDGRKTWSELSEWVKPNWTVRVYLPDGAQVEGKNAQFQADALTLQVVHTTDKLHGKGFSSVPRNQIKTVWIRGNRHNGRLIGTLVPLGPAVGIGVSASGGYFGGWAGAIVGTAVAVVSCTAGYFLGRTVDRRFDAVTVMP